MKKNLSFYSEKIFWILLIDDKQTIFDNYVCNIIHMKYRISKGHFKTNRLSGKKD